MGISGGRGLGCHWAGRACDDKRRGQVVLLETWPGGWVVSATSQSWHSNVSQVIQLQLDGYKYINASEVHSRLGGCPVSKTSWEFLAISVRCHLSVKHLGFYRVFLQNCNDLSNAFALQRALQKCIKPLTVDCNNALRKEHRCCI